MVITEYNEKEQLELVARDAREEGRKEGLEKGRREGLEDGRREGLEDGRREGLEKGRKEGLEDGRREGLEKGRKEGLEDGRREEQKNSILQIIQVYREDTEYTDAEIKEKIKAKYNLSDAQAEAFLDLKTDK